MAQYLESSYQTVSRTPGDEPTRVIKETKDAITDSLVGLMRDIETCADQFNGLLAMQERAIDSIACSTELLENRLRYIKSQQLLNGLNEMKLPNEQRPAMPTPSQGVGAGTVEQNSDKADSQTKLTLEQR